MNKILLVFTIAIFLAGCTGNNEGAGNIEFNSNVLENNSRLTQDFKKNYNDIYIEGQRISLPCSYKELIDMGFVDSEREILIEKGKPHLITVSKGNSSIDVYVGYNGSKNETLKSEGEIIAVLAKKMDGEERNNINLKFYGDITVDSNEDDVKRVLDLIEADENGSLYSVKMGKYSYFSVSFQGENIHDIMLVNGEEYF